MKEIAKMYLELLERKCTCVVAKIRAVAAAAAAAPAAAAAVPAATAAHETLLPKGRYVCQAGFGSCRKNYYYQEVQGTSLLIRTDLLRSGGQSPRS